MTDNDQIRDTQIFNHKHNQIQSINHIHIRFTLGIAILDLILFPFVLDFGIELSKFRVTNTIAYASIYFIEFMHLLDWLAGIEVETLGSGVGSLQVAGENEWMGCVLLEVVVEVEYVVLSL